MIPFGLTSLMTVSLPIGRRATKCLIPGASAIYLCNEGSGTVLHDYSGNAYDGTLGTSPATPTWASTGLTYDGNDHAHISAMISGLQGKTACTIQVVTWIAESVAHGGIIGPEDSTATGKLIFAIYDSSNGSTNANFVRMRVDNGTTGTAVNVPGRLTTTPTLLTMRFKGGASLEGRENLGTWTQTTTDVIAALNATVASPALMLGKRGTTGLNGGIGFMIAYPFALTDAQVAQNAAAIDAILAPRGIDINL